MGLDAPQQPHAGPPAGQQEPSTRAADDDHRSADIIIKADGIYSMAESREADARRYQAMAVAPLASRRLDPPDICLLYGTPGQMIFMINGLQWSGYKKMAFTSVGESACADSWGKALKTGEPALTIPCYAERRYGGVADDEMLMALPPSYLPKMIDGLAALSKNGLRYPVPPYGIQGDAAAGLAVSYADKDKKS